MNLPPRFDDVFKGIEAPSAGKIIDGSTADRIAAGSLEEALKRVMYVQRVTGDDLTRSALWIEMPLTTVYRRLGIAQGWDLRDVLNEPNPDLPDGQFKVPGALDKFKKKLTEALNCHFGKQAEQDTQLG